MTTLSFLALRRSGKGGLTPAGFFLEWARMQADRSDHEWVEALRTGTDGPVLADLRDYLRRTLAKGFGQRLDGADLEDLTQESLLRVHQKLDTFQGQSRFTTWATTITVNATLSQLRRRRYQHLSIEEAGEQADWSAEESATDDDEEQLEIMRRGIAEALTARQREAIEAALGGLPLIELARRYGVSQGAVYKLLHDARCRLKRFVLEAQHAADVTGVPS
jgi:RNA polymerase sigma-70 factor (ECF subfamily)